MTAGTSWPCDPECPVGPDALHEVWKAPFEIFGFGEEADDDIGGFGWTDMNHVDRRIGEAPLGGLMVEREPLAGLECEFASLRSRRIPGGHQMAVLLMSGRRAKRLSAPPRADASP